MKDYYAHCYGIRVLDQITIHDFFKKIAESSAKADTETNDAIKSLRSVLYAQKEYTEGYLKKEVSFYEITAAVAAIGLSIDAANVVEVLDGVLQTKIHLTGLRDHWEQYAHLAAWLCYLGSILELDETSIKDTYLQAVLNSMTSMSKVRRYGYSWYAYDTWNAQWEEILPPNRRLI